MLAYGKKRIDTAPSRHSKCEIKELLITVDTSIKTENVYDYDYPRIISKRATIDLIQTPITAGT